MQYDLKRYLLMILSLGAVVIIVALMKTTSVEEVISILLYPTLAFIPFSIIFCKFELYKVTKFDKKYSQVFAAAGLVLGAILIQRFTYQWKLYVIVFGFEFALLYYVIMVIKNRDKGSAEG